MTGIRFVRHAGLFAATDVLNKAVPFLLIPVLTRVLSPDDYGVTATFAALLGVLAVFVGLSSHGAVNVAYFRLGRERLARYVAAVVVVLATSAAAMCLVMLAGGGLVERWTGIPRGWSVLAVLLAAGQFVTLINLVLWQSEQQPGRFGAYQVSQTLVSAGLVLLLVVVFQRGWQGVLTAQAVATLAFAAASFMVLIRRGYLRLAFDPADIRDAVSFGLPLVPHALAGWMLTGIDRLLLAALVGRAETGLYATGYQLGLVIGVLAAAFNKAWVPYLFRQLGSIDDAGRSRIVKVSYAYFMVILLLAVGLAAAAPGVGQLVLGHDFQGATRFVRWVALGYAFDGMYYMVVNQIFYMKKTAWLAAVTLIVGVAHVAVSYSLIRLHGAVGAAQATTVSFFLMFALTWLVSAKVYPLPWAFWRARPVASA